MIPILTGTYIKLDEFMQFFTTPLIKYEYVVIISTETIICWLFLPIRFQFANRFS